MQQFHLSATRAQMQDLRCKFPMVFTLERFEVDSVNVEIHEDKVDDLYEWCEDHNVEITML